MTNNRDGLEPTNDCWRTLHESNTITANVTNPFQRTRLVTPSTDKHFQVDSEDDFRSGCRKVTLTRKITLNELLILSLCIIRYVPYCSSDAWSGNASKWETGGKIVCIIDLPLIVLFSKYYWSKKRLDLMYPLSDVTSSLPLKTLHPKNYQNLIRGIHSLNSLWLLPYDLF